jgi:hypothetical protein
MWVYQYSLYDPIDLREYSGNTARIMLPALLCEAPAHSNPLVQSILAEFGY